MAVLVTDKKVEGTAAQLRAAVDRVANPQSRPVVRKMADAVWGRDWESLGILAERLEGLEAWAGVGCGLGMRKVAENAIVFVRDVLREESRVATSVRAGSVARDDVDAWPAVVMGALRERIPSLTSVGSGTSWAVGADGEVLTGGVTLADALWRYLAQLPAPAAEPAQLRVS